MPIRSPGCAMRRSAIARQSSRSVRRRRLRQGHCRGCPRCLPSTTRPWTTYLSRRFELVRELAAELPVAETLPDTRWAAALQTKDAALARQLAAWRATNGVDRSEFRPCGPSADGDVYQQRLDGASPRRGRLAGRSKRAVAAAGGPTRARASPTTPGWPMLARALSRASDAGYDVPNRLPDLIGRRPLPSEHAARSLYWRFLDDCPDALEPERSTYRHTPPPAPSRPEPLPDYTRSQSRPSISRGGPRR